MKKNKLCLYINSKFGERILKKIGMIKYLNKNFIINYANFERIKNKKSFIFKYKKKDYIYYLLFFIQSCKLRNISSVYKYNVIRKEIKILILFFLIIFFKKIFYNTKFIRFLKKKISINSTIDKGFKKKKIDYLVIFCSSYGRREYDLIKAARVNNIKSILIVDNWDNLATKIQLEEKPDKLLVWGQEMVDCYNSCDYVDKKKIKIKIIGSPRYSYIKSKMHSLNKNFYLNKKKWEKQYNLNKNKKIILFLECIREKNPLKILQLLNNQIILDKLEDEVLILYRPHPLRKNNLIDFDKLNSLKNVNIDKSVKNLLIKSQSKDLVDEDVSVKNFLYSDSVIFCDGFISQITSGLLDLIYFGKKGLLMSDGTPQKLFDNFEYSQCYQYIYSNSFKNKIINKNNITIKFRKFCKNLKKSKYLKTDSKKINYIIKDLKFEKIFNELKKNIN